MKKIWQSTINAITGIKYAYIFDTSFRWELWGSAIYILFGYIFWPLEKFELMFLVLSYFLILIAELINTSLERALDKLHPEEHEFIGQSKDIASGAVFVAFLFSLFVAGLIIISYFI